MSTVDAPSTPPQSKKAVKQPVELVYARDGEVVLYKRITSKIWQARFKLNDNKWHRVSTKQRNVDYATKAACEAYDRARFLKAENLPITSKRFDAVAKLAPDGHFKFPHLWPVKLPQAGRLNYRVFGGCEFGLLS